MDHFHRWWELRSCANKNNSEMPNDFLAISLSISIDTALITHANAPQVTGKRKHNRKLRGKKNLKHMRLVLFPSQEKKMLRNSFRHFSITDFELKTKNNEFIRYLSSCLSWFHQLLRSQLLHRVLITLDKSLTKAISNKNKYQFKNNFNNRSTGTKKVRHE